MKTPVCFLMDDDEDDREIFTLALKKANASFSCVTAKSGHDALAQLNAEDSVIPDFIFVDLNMPLMHGKECLQHIKANSRFANTPVIIYTTSSYSKDVEDTQLLGASNFLVKPAGMALLTKALTLILAGSNLPYFIETVDNPALH